MTPTDRDIAQAAWNAFAQGCETGNWEGLINLLADDVIFYLPSGPFGGRNQGCDRFRAFAEYVTKKGRLVFEKPIRVSGSEGTIVFEAWDAGEINGKPIRNRIALSFDVCDGLIREMREYLGLVG